MRVTVRGAGDVDKVGSKAKGRSRFASPFATSARNYTWFERAPVSPVFDLLGCGYSSDVRLVQSEVNLDVDLHCHWATVLLSRLELPFTHGFDGLLIESHTQRT